MAGADDARIGALLDSLRGSGRGVGELVEAVDLLLRRLQKAEAALAVRRARESGVAAAVADPERAAALQERLEAADARLHNLEAAGGHLAAGLAAAVESQTAALEALGEVGGRLETLETDASKLRERVAGLASAAALEAVGQRVAEQGRALAHDRQRVGAAVQELAALQQVQADDRRVADATADLTGKLDRRLNEQLARLDQDVAGIDHHVVLLVKERHRVGELATTLGAVSDRVGGLEEQAAAHDTRLRANHDLHDETRRIAEATSGALRALAAEVAAHAAKTADDRLTLQNLAGMVGDLGERADGLERAVTTQARQFAETYETISGWATRTTALDERVGALAAAEDARASHLAALEGTVKLLVDESGQAAADDPKLRYMRHTGAPHAPDLYPVQGSQFQQDGVTKVVWRCRHCDYRHSQPVAGA